MSEKREVRSFLMPRDPSIDRRFRPRPTKRERLFCDIEEDEYDVESDSLEDDYDETQSTGDDVPTIETGALVYLRLKPVEQPSKAYSIAGDGNVFITGPSSESASSSKNRNCMEKHFSFSEIFDSEVSQREVYDKCIGEKIQTEESFTVLTYGTSGSGKTFTLLGNEHNPGIIQRSLENIFTLYQNKIYPHPIMKLVNGKRTILEDNMASKETLISGQLLECCKNFESNHLLLQQAIQQDHTFGEKSSDNDVSVNIWITFVEIYNELVYDLLEPPPTKINSSNVGANNNNTRKNLKIICNDGNVYIKGVTSVSVRSSLEALKLLRYGLQKVNYASTSINSNSSRSHCVFFVDVLKYYRSGLFDQATYKFCDLAGSERVVKTGNMGSRLKEAQRINTSLMILGRCLDAANNMASTTVSANKKERIPFRESKLTMILQAALQGNEKLAMIVNVTPVEKYYEENLNVLNFASIASNIIFKAPVVKKNQSRYSAFGTAPDNNYVQQLLEEIAGYKQRIEAQDQHIEAQDLNIEELIDETHFLKEEITRLAQEHEEELLKREQQIRNELVDSFMKMNEDDKKRAELRLKRELANERRLYETKIASLQRRHQDEMDDLREELEGGEEDSKDSIDEDEVVEIMENDEVEVEEDDVQEDMENKVVVKVTAEDKENINENCF